MVLTNPKPGSHCCACFEELRKLGIGVHLFTRFPSLRPLICSFDLLNVQEAIFADNISEVITSKLDRRVAK